VRFDEFLRQNSATATGTTGTPPADADKDALFKQFQAWQADQNARAQVGQAAGQVSPAPKQR
jgi:hypothetical protein